jgi:hypothetical protein
VRHACANANRFLLVRTVEGELHRGADQDLDVPPCVPKRMGSAFAIQALAI